MRRFVVMSILACAFLAAPVMAHDNDPNGPCDMPAEAAIAIGSLYVSTASPLVWSESNGVAGLQTHAHTCTDENGRTRNIGADTHIL